MLNKELFTTVTPLSKAIAMAIFIIFPFIFFVFGYWYGQQSVMPVIENNLQLNESQY